MRGNEAGRQRGVNQRSTLAQRVALVNLYRIRRATEIRVTNDRQDGYAGKAATLSCPFLELSDAPESPDAARVSAG